MFDQILSNLIVCILISQKNYLQKLHKVSTLQWVVYRFDISQNDFEVRLAKNQIEEGPLTDPFRLQRVCVGEHGEDVCEDASVRRGCCLPGEHEARARIEGPT